MLSREEAGTVAVKERAEPGKLLIAGTGAESTAETIARTETCRPKSSAIKSRWLKTPITISLSIKLKLYLNIYYPVHVSNTPFCSVPHRIFLSSA